jgi:hypothetical protein
VLCGGLLIGRLGTEVGRGRWNQLSGEERSALVTPQRWASGLQQLTAASARLLLTALELGGGLASWLAARRQPKASGKRWVRPETEAKPKAEPDGEAEGEAEGEADGAAVGEAVAGANGAAAEGPRTNAAVEAPPANAATGETPPTGALRGTGADSTSAEPAAAASSPSPPAHQEPTDERQPTGPREPAEQRQPTGPREPAEGFSGPGQPAGVTAEAAPAAQAMPIPQEPDPAPAPALESESESVEVEILDPPPPQRTVPDFHAIDALLRASGALPPSGPAEPPLVEAELEPEEGWRGA